MSAGGDELFWHWVSDARCQFVGDHLGVAVEEQNGQRPGEAPRWDEWDKWRVRQAEQLRQEGRGTGHGRTEFGHLD